MPKIFERITEKMKTLKGKKKARGTSPVPKKTKEGESKNDEPQYRIQPIDPPPPKNNNPTEALIGSGNAAVAAHYAHGPVIPAEDEFKKLPVESPESLAQKTAELNKTS